MSELQQDIPVTLTADDWAWIVGTLRADAERMAIWLDAVPEPPDGAEAHHNRLAGTADVIAFQVVGQMDGQS